VKLANAIATMEDQGAFLLDVALSGDERAIQILIDALKEMPKGERCLALLDAQCDADGRDDEVKLAANRLFHAVRDA